MMDVVHKLTLCVLLVRMRRRLWDVVKIWLLYLQPWTVDEQGPTSPFSNFEGTGNDETSVPTSTFGGASSNRKYTQEWQNFVLGNLPFYSLLLRYFTECVCRRLTVDADKAIQYLTRVLHVFAENQSLLQLVRDSWGAYVTYVELSGRSSPSACDRWHVLHSFK